MNTFNRISKALNVVIRVFENTRLKEYYAGVDPRPAAISIILHGNKYLPVVHRLEQIFDDNPSSEMLQDAPFVREYNKPSDLAILQGLKDAALSVSQYFKQDQILELKKCMVTLEDTYDEELKVRKFIRDGNTYGGCSHHGNHVCFPCKIVHCARCMVDIKPYVCSCKVEVSQEFIDVKIHGKPPSKTKSLDFQGNKVPDTQRIPQGIMMPAPATDIIRPKPSPLPHSSNMFTPTVIALARIETAPFNAPINPLNYAPQISNGTACFPELDYTESSIPTNSVNPNYAGFTNNAFRDSGRQCDYVPGYSDSAFNNYNPVYNPPQYMSRDYSGAGVDNVSPSFNSPPSSGNNYSHQLLII